MKKGDILICKKSIDNRCFIVGNKYIVKELQSDTILIEYKKNCTYYFQNDINYGSRYIFDYFIDIKEHRKLKISQIDENTQKFI